MGTDGISFVRPIGTRFLPKYQVPTGKHGGGFVMVSGFFHEHGVYRVEEIMKGDYAKVLSNIKLYACLDMGHRWR